MRTSYTAHSWPRNVRRDTTGGGDNERQEMAEFVSVSLDRLLLALAVFLLGHRDVIHYPKILLTALTLDWSKIYRSKLGRSEHGGLPPTVRTLEHGNGHTRRPL